MKNNMVQNPSLCSGKRSLLPRAKQPEALMMVLNLYQRDGLGGLLQLKPYGGGILGDEMGLGKTVQMIAYLVATREGSVKAYKTDRVSITALLIVPAGLMLK